MPYRIFVENPAPFKSAPRGEGRKPVDVPIEEGVETARFYLESELRFAGFHHSDLDCHEAQQMRNRALPERYDSLEYAHHIKQSLDGFKGILIPHRVIVYELPEIHAEAFHRLAKRGIKDVVLVGKPFSKPPQGVMYRNSVEQMLAFLVDRMPKLDLNLGVVVIHERRGEIERLLSKYEAAGGKKLRVIGQFLDSAESMLSFMEALIPELEKRGLSSQGLEWNVGLAMFTLKNRTFHAKLLRKNELACEKRFGRLQSLEARVEESVQMNLEFAERIKGRGEELGFNIGFSIQPIIERNPDGTIHAGLYGAVELARKLERFHT